MPAFKTLLPSLCVLTAIGAAGAPDARAATNATVISESLPVYSQMSSSSKVVKSLKKGDKVSVDIEIDAGEAWCSVSGIGGTGYVQCKGLERAPRAAAPSGPLPQVIEVGRGSASPSPGARPSGHPQLKGLTGGPFAPDFSLTELTGGTVSLASYKGQVVLLDFWATWCGPCRSEIPGFVELQNKFRDQGFTVIGISVDEEGPDKVKEFYQKFRMNYPVAMTDHDVERLYGGVRDLPTTFLIGRDGRIYLRLPGAVPATAFESRIKMLLASN